MTLPYLETLKETFSDVESFSPEKLEALLGETMKYFQDLQQKFQSEDPKEREKAMNSALEVKETLESQMESLCQSVGLDPSQLAALAKDPSKMTEEEKGALKKAQEQFASLHGEDKKDPLRAHKKKGPVLKLIG